MSYASDMGYDARLPEDMPGTFTHNEKLYPTTKILVDGYIKDVRYCSNCGSIDIGKSKRGYWYCKKICRKK